MMNETVGEFEDREPAPTPPADLSGLTERAEDLYRELTRMQGKLRSAGFPKANVALSLNWIGYTWHLTAELEMHGSLSVDGKYFQRDNNDLAPGTISEDLSVAPSTLSLEQAFAALDAWIESVIVKPKPIEPILERPIPPPAPPAPTDG
jgi:hypothetical protein